MLQVAYIQCRHSIPALIAWAARTEYTTARLIDTGYGCMDDLTTECCFIHELHGSLMCLTHFLILSMGVCTTRQWQTSGRPIRELNVYTVISVQQAFVTPSQSRNFANILADTLSFRPNSVLQEHI